MTLSQYLYLNLGYSEKLGIDLHFLKQAHFQDMAVIELESFAYQFGLLSGLSQAEQIALLTETLTDFAHAQEQADQLADNWRQGDLAAMDKLIGGWFDDRPDLQRVQDILLLDRNKSMAARVHGLLFQGHRPFVVVGAGHLIGTGSVVDLLRQRGYQIERL
jgi:uncharacterized protein YbaP (TraB family)